MEWFTKLSTLVQILFLGFGALIIVGLFALGFFIVHNGIRIKKGDTIVEVNEAPESEKELTGTKSNEPNQ